MKFFNLKYLLIALSLLIINACKPTVSLSGATIPTEAKTISVGYFTNNSSLAPPSLAQQFSEKMRDMVSQQTSLALIKNNADLQFEGYISDYNVAPISIQSNDQASQNRLTITVNVKYSNKFDATKNFEQAFTRFADYSSTKTLSSVESELITVINKQLAEDIFNKAFNNW
ncbi:MAG: LPS assembly lipoprotein LptE [Bacteroidetes bacterium]|nr:LPS assembly lipoprotein LptE [Bacteroidota bacterium]